ncbi:MAG TPA: RNA polymerase sigma-54 factor [Verrucomicrobia bacterium]|nr:RNA polymerase factor sigma-54 [Verrucomicrobiales bacterium]HIL54726.1 RNA polymerase sigma-54 factor [Verrucomicrobiota bacterium]
MAGFELQHAQTQSLELRAKIAPQMQQSLNVLQATTLELNQMIGQELAQNPVLEEESVDISVEEEGLDKDEEDFDEEFSELSKLDQEWREYLQQSRSNTPRRADDNERHQRMMDSIIEPQTLSGHLIQQLNTSDSNSEIRDLAEMLIGSVNEDGFLSQNIEEIALENAIPFMKLQEALDLVQSFHPIGIAAQDLRECLLLQLNHLNKKHSLEYRIVDLHLDQLARKRYPQIARKIGIGIEKVTTAAEFIATLNPKPGRELSLGDNHYITPDVSVEKTSTGYDVTLNNETIPHLRISNVYKDIMSGGNAKKDAKEYIREKIQSGKFLIKCIHQRQETIRKISEEIVNRQRDFLDHGIAHLHPMNMAQVAEVVGVHETTVSRAIAGKYIATPRGVFEMKYFFKPGYETDSGDTLSNTSVKQAVAELVKNEDKKKPLSDDKIVQELKESGIKLARRTVAKYRDEIGILPSHLRRTY